MGTLYTSRILIEMKIFDILCQFSQFRFLAHIVTCRTLSLAAQKSLVGRRFDTPDKMRISRVRVIYSLLYVVVEMG